MVTFIKLNRIVPLLIIGLFSVIPLLTNAQGPGSTPAPAPAAGNGLSFSIVNPLAFKSIPLLIEAVIGIIIVIGTPIIVLFIILAGFKYVTAQGNPGKIQEATAALTYAIIGGVLIIGAYAIAQIIAGFVDSFAS